MNRKKILLAAIVLTIAIVFVTPYIVASILNKRITAALNERYPDFTIEFENVHWSLFTSRLQINKITFSSKTEHTGAWDSKGEITSVEFKGIKLLKAIFKNKYEIDEIIISNSQLEGRGSFPDKDEPPTVSSISLHIGNILFDRFKLSLKDSLSAKTFSIKEGILKIVDFGIEKLDTFDIPNHFDFKAERLLSVSADSMYTYIASGIVYSDSVKTLSVDSLSIAPNYNEYDFTERYKYEIDRIDAVLNKISLSHFTAFDYFNSGNLVSSSIDIGNMDLNVFRDKRKADSQKKKPAFQELIYNYPGLLRVDSIGINSGNISYTEHAEKANEPGRIFWNKLKAKVYNVTNDTIYKTKDASLTMMLEAMLMGKSKLAVSLKAKLFDNQNTFSVDGSLGELEVKELTSILENNAFVYANSAKIDQLSFNFRSNDSKATGKLTMLYHGLDLAVKNKRTDDTTAIKEQVVSFIANTVTWDSNPVPGEKVRVGVIDYERDPMKFFFNYCLKSIVSGIKSSIIKTQKKKKTFLQKIFGVPNKKQ